MKMSFGKKYKDKEVAWVLIEDPGYFKWMNTQGLTNKPEYQFMLGLLKTLDSRPFSHAVCHGHECDKKGVVTRFCLYNYRYNMISWWCDKCDPYSHGALPGRLTPVSKMDQVVFHPDNDKLVKLFAAAKGVPKRKTKKSLQEYFRY